VVKRFYIYEHRTTSLREIFRRLVLRKPISVRTPQFSLEGLDLTVEAGEGVVLIGRNGAGKSTSLRLMAGIYEPTAGSIEVNGRLATVIELGAGFQPDLTGEENVALYGAIMGFSRQELRERFDEIVAFADIGDFMQTPVKYYSSGMQARLAFAVAICVEADILILDEVLAVGDREFREKCLNRLREFRAQGGTLVVVTHDLETARSLCERAVWIDQGRVRMTGDADSVMEAYWNFDG
jgi:ABC-type polysaccharide/polyol phosphate transport system ATPase subunit